MKNHIATPNPDEPNNSPFDAIKETDEAGEYWSGRRLMPLLDYADWRNLRRAIDQARTACTVELGETAAQNHFVETNEMVSTGSGAVRKIQDYRLSRAACYMTAMRGDASKAPIAAALVYFAARTREAELQAARPMTELELAHRYIAALEREQALATTNTHLAERVAELAPKAEGYDDLIAADGYMDLGAAAKALAPATGGIGRTRFINLLRGMAILMQASTLPYQHLIDRGYFAVRTEVTGSGAYPYTVVTPKGLRWLHAEMRDERPTLGHGDTQELPAGGTK